MQQRKSHELDDASKVCCDTCLQLCRGRYESTLFLIFVFCLQEFRCYNGTCFSPDGRTMYATETPLQMISRYDYDPDTGEISNKRLFVEVEASGTVEPFGKFIEYRCRRSQFSACVCK